MKANARTRHGARMECIAKPLVGDMGENEATGEMFLELWE
jgi:hypothetical protein